MLLCVVLYIMWLLCFVMLYMLNLCLVWLICIGLFFYDYFVKCELLFGLCGIDMCCYVVGVLLIDFIKCGFVYFDGWVDDVCFVVLNVMDVKECGVEILMCMKFLFVECCGDEWEVWL